ncbi:amidase [Oricola cellulosilytica]|nr:amidase family protein [Oricola cellulosilytica]
MENIVWASDATGLAAHIRKGDVSPAEVMEAAIARAEAVNPYINAIAEHLYDSARAAAKKVHRAAPFAGVPMAIKDLGISINGVPIHWGSRVRPNISTEDSTLVERFRAAGFVPLATSTTSEFGLRLVTETERFGVTRNPWNTGHVTGGSSGGSAALVAAGVVPVAHASDGGGSIRVPAACCGLVGMKPSRGRVPFTPDFLEGWFGLLAQHVVTRSVRDSAAILDLASAPDPYSPYQASQPAGTFSEAAHRRPKGLRIGIYGTSPLGLAVSDETQTALERAADLAREAGHRVEEIDLPVTRDFFADFARIVAVSFAGQMRMEGVRLRGAGTLGRIARVLRRYGELTGGGEFSASVLRMQEVTHGILTQTAAFDAVLMPVIAHPPLPCGGLDPRGLDLLSEQLLDALHLTPALRLSPLIDKLIDQSLWFTHWPAIQNVTGQPAIALPVHVTGEGLPLGIQAVGRMGDEETLFSLAAQLEAQVGWRDRRAPLLEPQ